MNKEIEETIKILEELIKGDEDCLKTDLANNLNDEDVQHWKKEIKAIKTIINCYNREKARADKLEKEYSRMLTKLDEYEAKLQELDNSISKEVIEKKKREKDKDRELYWNKNNIMLNFIDKKTAKISKEELETNDKHMQLNGEVKALQELLEEN